MVRVRWDPVVTLVAQGMSVGGDLGFDDGVWRLSVAAFVVDVPRFLVPLVVASDNSLKITETALQLGVFRSLEAGHRGLFVGPEIYAYQLVTTDEVQRARHAVSYEIYAHLTAGGVFFPATWFGVDDPLLSRIFAMPWVTVGVPMFGTGDAVFADGVVVRDRLLNWHGTVSLGIELSP